MDENNTQYVEITAEDLGPGMEEYKDALGRQTAHRLKFPRFNMSAQDFPDIDEYECMCGESHKVRMALVKV